MYHNMRKNAGSLRIVRHSGDGQCWQGRVSSCFPVCSSLGHYSIDPVDNSVNRTFLLTFNVTIVPVEKSVYTTLLSIIQWVQRVCR